MKKSIFIALALIVTATTLCPQATAKVQEEKKQEKKMTKAELRRQNKAEAEARQIFVIDSILNARSFTFVAERVITQIRETTINYRAYMTINDSKIECQLPFYGESSSVSYSSTGSPLDFKAEDISYQSAPLTNKKDGKAFVLIKAKSSGKSYTIGIEIFNNGYAGMSINISGASPQTFYGQIEPIKQTK